MIFMLFSLGTAKEMGIEMGQKLKREGESDRARGIEGKEEDSSMIGNPHSAV